MSFGGILAGALLVVVASNDMLRMREIKGEVVLMYELFYGFRNCVCVDTFACTTKILPTSFWYSYALREVEDE